MKRPPGSLENNVTNHTELEFDIDWTSDNERGQSSIYFDLTKRKITG